MHKIIYIIILVFIIPFKIDAQIIHTFSPATIDPALTAFNTDSIYTYSPNLFTAKNQLLVFLPGTGAAPTDYQLIGEKAMEEGYHVIILTYNNEPTIHSLCNDSPNNMCYENTRLEVIDGIDRGTTVDVNEHHSILGRLKRTLQRINLEFPFENYEFFISGEELVMDKIAWSGHSQGGGHAALIAQKYFSPRVICFASPKDYSNFFDAPAAWYSNTWETPTDNIFGFGHTFDGYVKQKEIFEAMNLDAQGPLRIVENTIPPYSNTHQLFTNRPIGIIASHSVMIYDDLVPFENGINVYDEAWTYLLSTPTTVGIQDLNDQKINIEYGPNPVVDFLKISSNLKGNFDLTIYNMSGKSVYKNTSFSLQNSLDMRTLPSGIYSITLRQNFISKSIKIVKK